MLLLLLLLLHYLWAKEVPGFDTKYHIQQINSCPVEGYFFKRQSEPNSLGPALCHLCFCQDNGTAVCWLRNNRRCNVESYHHHNVGKRDTRQRRSPLGLGELFFRDAAREVFNKQTPEVCKPFESSFSEGCPPEDWCIGCTVCDCNANGRWDCRVLSFCGDDKTKKQMKKRNSKPKVIKLNQKNIPKSTNKKVSKKTVVNQTLSKPPMNAVVKRAPTPIIAPSRNKKTIQKGINSPKPLIFKKDIQTRKPLTLSARKKANDITQSPVSDQFTQEVVKKVVTAMQKLLRQQVTATIPEIVKIVHKKTIEMNNLNNKIQKNKVSNVAKRKVAAISKKQYNRIASNPAKNNKATKIYNGSTDTTKSTRSSPTGTTLYGKPRTVANKKANTKLMKSYRHKRHAFLDNELTTEMARSLQLGNFSNNATSANRVLKESVMFNTSAIDGNGNYSEDITTLIYSETIDNHSFMKYSSVNAEDITNEPQSLNYSDFTLAVTEGLFNNNTIKTQMYNESKKIHVLLDKIVNANELKYMEWSQMKTFKEKEREYRSQSNNTNSSLYSDNSNMNYSTVVNLATEAKVKIHRYDVKRKLDTVPKRFNVIRVVSTMAGHLKHKDRSYSVNSNNGRMSKKNDKLEGILKNLFVESEISNTIKSKTRRKLNVFKYLKKFFRKLFYKSKNKSVDADIIDHKHTINTLCAIFGPCVINKENKALVQRKFKELNNETHLMMRSINIIKGLLRLIDFPLPEKSANDFRESKDRFHLKGDIQKLALILKTQHNDPDQASKLSETQLTQIAYIKNNTRFIIQSIVRFGNILNDVIDILTLKNSKIHKKEEMSSSVENNRINTMKLEPLAMLKQLLGKYNIVQNTFVMKMQEILNKVQPSNSNGPTNGNESSTNTNKASDSRATDRFTNTILRNIRKLKNIADVLSPGVRKKRQIERSDDTMEYLLMIMEYLMKKNKRVDVAPANDGIDLLIQAIQNAPDIKPVTKHVRVYLPLKKVVRKAFRAPVEDSFSDSKISKESNFTLKANNYKTIPRDQSIDDDTYFNPIQFNKRVDNKDNKPSFREKNNSTENKKQTTVSTDQILEKNTSIPFKLQITNKDSNKITEGNQLNREDNILDEAYVTNGGGGNRKFEVFVPDYEDDTDNEEVFNVTTSAPEPLTKQSEPTISSLLTDDFKLSDMKLRQFNDDVITNSNVKFITKPILQWIDSNEEEDESHLDKFLTTPETITPPVTKALTQPVTSKKPIKKSPEDISDFSKELDDEDKKKLSKVNTDEVMFKKQMNLLNSLDYGTERPDDSDSKDVRFPNDHYDIL